MPKPIYAFVFCDDDHAYILRFSKSLENLIEYAMVYTSDKTYVISLEENTDREIIHKLINENPDLVDMVFETGIFHDCVKSYTARYTNMHGFSCRVFYYIFSVYVH